MSFSLLRPMVVIIWLAGGPICGSSVALADPSATTDLQRMALSARLYQDGQELGDAVMVLAAARLRASVGLTPTERPVLPPGDGAAQPLPAPLQAAEMLETARALARGDEALLGMIADTGAARIKGLASGPLYSLGMLAPGGEARIAALPFRGGEYAEVYVEARMPTDLRLTVTDEAGQLVCADHDPFHIAYCGWRPDAPGLFTITVENRGQGTSYALMTN
jgi:hypothetical protein